MARLHRRKDRGSRWELGYVDIDGTRYRINTATTDRKVADLWLKKVEERMSQARLGIIEKVGLITADVVSGREDKPKTGTINLDDLRKDYEQRCRDDLELDENTVELANTAFGSLIEVVGNKRLSQFLEVDVVKWKRTLDHQGKKKTTVSIYYRALRAAFNRAVRWKLIEQNPFLNVDVPTAKRGERPPKTMQIEEVRKLLQTIEDDGNSRFATYIRFLLYTGCRRNEILFLQWEDVDLENRILRVNADKTDRILRLPINKALLRVIQQMSPDKGYVFKTGSHSRSRKKQGQPWHEATVTHWFKVYIQKAGLPDHYTIHSLRHTYTNHLRAKGVPIDIIQRLLGHSTPKTTWDHYDASDALFFRQQADLVDFEEEESSA